MTDEAKRLYSMKLHETTAINRGTNITRVPGGWRYVCKNGTDFVPYSDEFAPDSKWVTYDRDKV